MDSDSDIDVQVKPVGNAGRCTKISTKRVYHKSRKYHGNQHSKKGKKKKTVERKSVVSENAKKSTVSG